MASLKQKLKSLHRRNSKRHTLVLFLLLLVFLGLSATARYYALVPLRMMDSSMSPGIKEQDLVWMCKLPNCLGNFQEGDIVLASLRGNEKMVRKILALPGDTIQIDDKGIVTTPRKKFKWKNEDSFIQSRKFYVPKAGDTLQFENLNDVEQDYIISYLRDKGQHVIVQTTLWQGEHEINLDRVGATKIANRQVSLNEVDFLPWQDRFLIETQIRQSEPGNAPITLKRNIFRGIKKEVVPVPIVQPTDTTTDSTTATSMDSTDRNNELVEIVKEPIKTIVIEEDCYYLICNKGANCPDSRETGYVTTDKISGRYVEWPTKVDRAVVTPAVKTIKSGIQIISDVCSSIVDSISSLFSSDAKDAEENKTEDKKTDGKSAPAINKKGSFEKKIKAIQTK